MSDRTLWETLKAESGDLLEKLKALIHEGNVRRIVVQYEGRSIAEFPVTAGIVGAVLAPVLAAVGALVALLKDCTIHVERTDAGPSSGSAEAGGPPAAEDAEQKR